LPSQTQIDKSDATAIEEGRKLIHSEAMRCGECHQFQQKDEEATAPDLTGYGSKEWLTSFIKNPAHERFYGKRNDRMPVFGEEGRLEEHSLKLIVDWLREDWPKSEIARR